VPEIKRVELSQVVLQLLTLGIQDVAAFEFMDPPPKEAVQHALFVLLALGAVRVPSAHEVAARVQNGSVNATEPEQGVPKRGSSSKRLPELTSLGKQMAALPLEPMHAKFLIDAKAFNCMEEAITIAAMLSVESPLFTPRNARAQATKAHARFASYDADHLTLLNVYFSYVQANRDRQWCTNNFVKLQTLVKADHVREQLVALAESTIFSSKAQALKPMEELPAASPAPPPSEPAPGSTQSEAILRCLVSAFALRVAQKLPKDNMPGVRYKTVLESLEVRIHPSSNLVRRDPMAEWVVFNELVMTSNKYIKGIAAVEQTWLAELAPSLFAANETSAVDQTAASLEGAAPSRQQLKRVRERGLLMCD